MKGFIKDDKFHPINDYKKKGTRKSRDQKAKHKGVKIRKQRVEGEQFSLDDRVETTEQISQDVLGGEKGTVLGRRFHPDGTIDVEVQFDLQDQPYFVDPELIRKISETKLEHEAKQKLCPVCQVRPRGEISRLCDQCLTKQSRKNIRKREQEIFDNRVRNITEELEEQGKSFKQIKRILKQTLGDRPKDLT